MFKRVFSVSPLCIGLSLSSYAFADVGDRHVNRQTLQVGEELLPGESIQDDPTNFEMHKLILQEDGNLVYYADRDYYKDGVKIDNPVAVWSSGTQGKKVNKCVLQNDGNLVLLGPNDNVIWASGTAGKIRNDYKLRVTYNGHLCIYSYDPVWASNTSRSGYPEVNDPYNQEWLEYWEGLVPSQPGLFKTILKSDNKIFRLELKGNKDLVLYKKENGSKVQIWHTGTEGKAILTGSFHKIHDGGWDGSFKLWNYMTDEPTVFWSTNTDHCMDDIEKGDLNLRMQNDGNLVLYKSNTIWQGFIETYHLED